MFSMKTNDSMTLELQGSKTGSASALAALASLAPLVMSLVLDSLYKNIKTVSIMSIVLMRL